MLLVAQEALPRRRRRRWRRAQAGAMVRLEIPRSRWLRRLPRLPSSTSNSSCTTARSPRWSVFTGAAALNPCSHWACCFPGSPPLAPRPTSGAVSGSCRTDPRASRQAPPPPLLLLLVLLVLLLLVLLLLLLAQLFWRQPPPRLCPRPPPRRRPLRPKCFSLSSRHRLAL
jgi:hypothetical protein